MISQSKKKEPFIEQFLITITYMFYSFLHFALKDICGISLQTNINLKKKISQFLQKRGGKKSIH